MLYHAWIARTALIFRRGLRSGSRGEDQYTLEQLMERYRHVQPKESQANVSHALHDGARPLSSRIDVLRSGSDGGQQTRTRIRMRQSSSDGMKAFNEAPRSSSKAKSRVIQIDDDSEASYARLQASKSAGEMEWAAAAAEAFEKSERASTGRTIDIEGPSNDSLNSSAAQTTMDQASTGRGTDRPQREERFFDEPAHFQETEATISDIVNASRYKSEDVKTHPLSDKDAAMPAGYESAFLQKFMTPDAELTPVSERVQKVEEQPSSWQTIHREPETQQAVPDDLATAHVEEDITVTPSDSSADEVPKSAQNATNELFAESEREGLSWPVKVEQVTDEPSRLHKWEDAFKSSDPPFEASRPRSVQSEERETERKVQEANVAVIMRRLQVLETMSATQAASAEHLGRLADQVAKLQAHLMEKPKSRLDFFEGALLLILGTTVGLLGSLLMVEWRKLERQQAQLQALRNEQERFVRDSRYERLMRSNNFW